MTDALIFTLAQQSQNPATNTGSDAAMIWGIILIGIAVLLFVVEVLLPTGGIVGVASAICLVAGIIMFFQVDTTLGLISTIVTLIALPFAIVFALQVWPHTPIGRAMTLSNDDADEAFSQAQARKNDRMSLVGKTGRAITELRPVGECLINGERYECIAGSTLIDADADIEVIDSDGMMLKVREVKPST